MNLHERQMPVTWENEWFVSLYNAVNDDRIVDNLGNFILSCSFAHDLMHLHIWCNLYIKMIHKNVGILFKNQYGWTVNA